MQENNNKIEAAWVPGTEATRSALHRLPADLMNGGKQTSVLCKLLTLVVQRPVVKLNSL